MHLLPLLSYDKLFVESRLPHMHCAPVRVTHLNFANIFGVRKLESLCYCAALLA